MSTGSAVSAPHSRPPFWRDVRVLRVIVQVVFLVLVALFLYYLYTTMTGNMRRQGLRTGFQYLDQPAGFAIPHSDFSSGSDFLVALRYGVKNTAIISFTGIALATFLGIIVGVMRLSSNWLVRKAAAAYVETLRNIPILLIIFFWYFAVLLRLPSQANAMRAPGTILSNAGLSVPSFAATGNADLFAVIAVVGLVAGGIVAWWRTRLFDRTGTPHHRVLWGFGTFLAIATVAYVALSTPLELSLPEVEGFRVFGGISMSAEFAALLFALTIYTASHIAEIVRGSILAVPKGQSEAARAVGLTEFQRMRHVVLPQAFRIMVPPLANQFLNLTKNSSLGVAIGYYEITKITQVTISQGGPAPQSIALLMVLYLGFSLSISFVSNLVNRRLLRVQNR